MRKLMTIAAVLVALTVHAELMLTPWGEKVTDANAWRDYPRPQMVRANWKCLNGLWDYAITAITNTTGRPAKWDGKIRVLDNVPMRNSVEEMMTDYQNNLWFASSRQGVMKIVPNQFTDVFDANDLDETVVNTTCYCDDKIFIGALRNTFIIVLVSVPVVMVESDVCHRKCVIS